MSERTSARATRGEAIELAAELSIAQAVELQRALKDRLSAGSALVIDGRRVMQIDTAILQLLVSARRGCVERGITLSWNGVSEPLRRYAALIGLAEHLDFPSTATAS